MKLPISILCTLITLFFCCILDSAAQSSFLESQLRSPRVKKAFQKKNHSINKLLDEKNINSSEFDVFLRAFKSEQKLELWVKNKNDQKFTFLKSYDFCAKSGNLGPKRRSGDKQTPEGIYTVDFFNPESKYYLSFRLDYPNSSDKILSDPINPGDNIFIHGDCVTIGCIPVGNENIEELYLIVVRAKSKGVVPVHIFPFQMEEDTFKKYKSSDTSIDKLWSHLKPIYTSFETSKIIPTVVVNAQGDYILK